jgi:2-oxoglutarate dehydrogenase E2 component (dihydrolipoamide succinyltransferase)
MADIVMPQLGESVTEGTITRWFKGVGDTVTEDEPLFEVSTDKVDTEVPAPAAGVLSEIRVAEGETVVVGTVLAVLGDAGPAPAVEAQPEVASAPPEAAVPVAPVVAPAETPPTAPPSVPPTAPPVTAPPPVTPPASVAPPLPEPVTAEPVAEPEPAPAPAPPVAEPTSTPAAPITAAGQAAPPAAPVPPGVPAGATPSEATAGRLLSPMVRKLVDEHRLDPSTIPGTGVGGRITREDVLDAIDARAGAARSAQAAAPVVPAVPIEPVAPAAPVPPAAPAAPAAPAVPAPAAPVAPAAPAAPAAPSRPAPPAVTPMRPGEGDTVEQLNRIRRLTGDLMVQSKASSPHVVTAVEVDYSAVEAARLPRREAFRTENGFSLTYLPFVARAVVDALAEFPHMNASMGEGEVILHNEVQLSIAVDLDYQGLLAPVVRDAHDKRLKAIAEDIFDLATRARSKQLSPDELAGGTFTLSNSGAYGSFLVAPIINQPQVAIMSTDGVSRKPVVVVDATGGEAVGIHPVGVLTLVWDHRAFDGAYAAAFMSRVREIIETRDWNAEL